MESALIITKHPQGSALTISLEGQLNALTTKELNTVLETSLTGVDDLTFDLEKLRSISSAGLRSLLIAQKTVGKSGKMVVCNCNETVMETFCSIGFDRIMTII